VLITMAVAAVSFFVLYAPSSPYERPWGWGGQDAADGARLQARDAIGPEVPVRAATSMLVLLAERRDVYHLDIGSGDDPIADPAAATDGVDVVVIDRSEFTGPTAAREKSFELGIENRGFAVQSDAEDIVVLVRTPPTG
jgi:hypothetical protein